MTLPANEQIFKRGDYKTWAIKVVDLSNYDLRKGEINIDLWSIKFGAKNLPKLIINLKNVSQRTCWNEKVP